MAYRRWMLSLGFFMLSACFHNASSRDVAATVNAHPNVRIERRDGSTVQLSGAAVVGDSVIGASGRTRRASRP